MPASWTLLHVRSHSIGLECIEQIMGFAFRFAINLFDIIMLLSRRHTMPAGSELPSGSVLSEAPAAREIDPSMLTDDE